jgi:hypothetical protein
LGAAAGLVRGPKEFFDLKYEGIGVARDSALLMLTRSTTFLSTKKGSTSDECSLHED